MCGKCDFIEITSPAPINNVTVQYPKFQLPEPIALIELIRILDAMDIETRDRHMKALLGYYGYEDDSE